MFEKIKGHERILTHLEKEIANGEVSHAYLFEGIDGIGKKKTAFAFAKVLLCTGEGKKPCGKCRACIQVDHGNYPDIQLIEPKPGEATIKILQIRELISGLAVKPYSGNWRIIVIDGADKMTTEAQNSLLKSLEEPLSYNIFILLTSRPKDILRTIRSRCQNYFFHPLKESEIIEILLDKTEETRENILDTVKSGGGSPGMCLYLLENKEIKEQRQHYMRELYSILKGDSIKIFSLGEAFGKDKEFSQEMLRYLIQWFYEIEILIRGLKLSEGKLPSEAHKAYVKLLNEEKNQGILKTLFEMMETLQYNVNLRLQWEKTLIEIMEIQKRGTTNGKISRWNTI